MMQKKNILYKGQALNFRVSGKGPAIVLLHGFGEDGNIWNAQLHAFPHHTLVVPDLPGSGESAYNGDVSMEGMASAVKAILNDLGIQQCILIGHSMGGYITLAFAEMFRETVTAIGLFHSSAFADTEEKIATRRKGISFIRENGAAAFLKTATPNLYSSHTREQHPEIVEAHIRSTASFTNEALTGYYEAMIARPDRTAVLRDINIPVLFVMGKEDAAVPMADTLKQVPLPLTSQVELLEKSGHMGMVEEPEKATEILIQFVKLADSTA